MHKCVNKSIGNVYHLEQLVGNFFPYSQKQLGFDQPVTIVFQSDKSNSMKMLGKTAYYDPAAHEVYLYVDGRHPKDVMRSLSHELVHHAQNCRGEFSVDDETGPGYAQTNPHMRKMEREAYTKGNLIFRDFEDLIKTDKITIDIDFKKSGEPKMSLKEWKDNELNTLLMKKWGLFQEAKDPVTTPLNEDDEAKESENYGKDESADKREEDRLERHLDAIEHHLKALRDDMEFNEKHIDESTDEESEITEDVNLSGPNYKGRGSKAHADETGNQPSMEDDLKKEGAPRSEAEIEADTRRAIASGEDPVVAATAGRRGQVHDVVPAAPKKKLRRGPKPRRPRSTGPGMALGPRFEGTDRRASGKSVVDRGRVLDLEASPGADKKMISVTEATKLTRKIIERYLKEGK